MEKKLTSGRGSKLLEVMKARYSDRQVESSASDSFRDVQSSLQQEAKVPKMGRGQFLLQLAQMSKLKAAEAEAANEPTSKIDTRSVSSASEVSKSSLFKDFEEMSLEEEKPPCDNRGNSGVPIKVFSNYIRLLTDPSKGVFEFEVKFEPDIDFVAFRYKLIHQHFQSCKGIKCYDGGSKLYMPEKITSDSFILEGKHPVDASEVKITITFKRQMLLRECAQLYNILFNNCAKVLNLTRLGKNHFDYRLGHQIPQHKLEVWPGYVTSVEEFEGGVQLCCDIRHKVLRFETAHNILVNIAKYSSQNFKTLAFKELVGQCVLTRYNNNLYRIDDIDWEKNPMSTFKTSSGEEITFLDYYKKQYNLNITDFKQPLLINKPKKNRDENSRLICLVPELCHMTGLTDKMRKDMKVMKEIAAYTRVTPMQRHLGLQKFVENINTNPRAQEMLLDWGLKLDTEPIKLDARILPDENIFFKNKTKISKPLNGEWSRQICKYGVLRSVEIKHWLLIHPKKDSNLANSFANMIRQVAPGLGIKIYDPVMVSLKDDKIDSYITGSKENMNPKVQVIVYLCPTARDDRYSAIKKLCSREMPVLSQVVNCGTIARENRLRSVVQNIALQINNKLGGASWAMHIPLKNCMICGIDSYHDCHEKGNSIGGFVASLDSEYTQWYSQTCIQEPRQELLDGLVCCFVSSLRKYIEVNDILPERIVIFRDGVGDGQLSAVKNHEVKQFLEACFRVSPNYKPKFSFVVVQKKINTKFYLHGKSSVNTLENPEPGSVVDHTITRRNFFDFFLVSQHVSCGTATPSHYIVVYDNSGWKPDLIQRLTYKFCHLYYNWPGTIKVPAPCQYAHKLAYLVGKNIKESPHRILENKLHYL